MKRLAIPVDEYVTPNPVVVGRETPVAKVVELMQVHDVRHIPVVEGARPVGIISQRDVSVLANVASLEDLRAGDVMTPAPYVVHSGVKLEQVVFHMSETKIGSAIIVGDDGTVDGIFTSTDALNALIEILRGDLPEEAEDGGDGPWETGPAEPRPDALA